jgi:hypothetical protein
MPPTDLIKIKEIDASKIAEMIDLSDDAKLLLKNDTLTSSYLYQLIEQKMYVDAVRFLAAALPKREAVWWACLCNRDVLTESSKPTEQIAIELAEAWVFKPTEENRVPTFLAAENATLQTSAGWVAMATFWSSGSISPVENTIVQPAEDLTAKAVSGSVMLAAVSGSPEKIEAYYSLFLKRGMSIANGGDGRDV